GFVIVAVLMRPLGGILSDRIGAVRTLLYSYIAVAAAALMLAFQPALMPLGTIDFIVMAAGLGLGSGAVFALVSQTSDPSVVGSVTGFVGAAGGLGGFVPPLIMAAIHADSGSYSFGIVLLLLATLGAIVVTFFVARGARASAQEPSLTSRWPLPVPVLPPPPPCTSPSATGGPLPDPPAAPGTEGRTLRPRRRDRLAAVRRPHRRAQDVQPLGEDQRGQPRDPPRGRSQRRLLLPRALEPRQ